MEGPEISSPKQKPHRVNGSIRARSVIVIDEQGKNRGEMILPQALDYARSVSLDLIEVSSGQAVPVCKVADYGKMKYQEAKKDKRSNRPQVSHKEIKLTPATGNNDYMVKLRKVEELLKKGHTVSIIVSLRGRMAQRPEAGHTLLDRFREDLADCGKEQSRNSSPRVVSSNYTPVHLSKK